MNKIFTLTAIFFVSLFTTNLNIKAQDADVSQLIVQDYYNIELPSLAVLFENAKSSSTVKYYDARKEAEKSLLKTIKGDWLKYFKIVGSYQYGIMGATSSLSEQNQTTTVYQLSNSKQTWYNVGVAFSVPFDEFFDRKNKIKKQKFEMEATYAEVERWHDEQKMRIIEVYTRALQSLAVLKAKAETMVVANAQYKIAEDDFINGRIKPADLTARKSIQTNAIVDYELTKATLNASLLQLEVLSNTKIIKKAN